MLMFTTSIRRLLDCLSKVVTLTVTYVSRADDRLAAVAPAYLFIYAPFAAADRPTLIVTHYRG